MKKLKLLFIGLMVLLFVKSAQSSCKASFTTTISGYSVAFTNTSTSSSGSGSIRYTWIFSDSTSSNLKNPTKVYTSSGIKIVQLSMFDSITSCTATTIDSFYVSGTVPPCAAAFSKTISGLTVTLSNFSVNSIGTTTGLIYNWTFGDGTSSTLKNVSKTYTTGGLKMITLEINDSTKTCSNIKTESFYLSSNLCHANFTKTISDRTVTLNNLSVNSVGTTAGLAYTWGFSDGPYQYIKNPSNTFTFAGPQVIYLSIYDSIGNCSATKSDSFNIVSSNSCAVYFSKTISGLTASFTNNSVNAWGLPSGLLYAWNFGDATTSNQKDPVKTFATAGLKIIQLTITDTAHACTKTEYDTILLIAPTPLCSASFKLAVDTTTPFSFFLLNTSLVRTGSTFYWTFGDGGSSTSSTPTHTYATFGKYLVCLTVSDSACTSTYCDSIGMDSTGRLLKKGGFSFKTLDYTKLADPTGLSNLFEPIQFHIYPNPSAGEVNVEVNLKEASSLYIEMTDISGKSILSKNIKKAYGEFKETINLSELNPSVYFLSIRSNQGLSTFKILKN